MMILKELNANVNALCTSGTLKSTSSASRAISAVAEIARDADDVVSLVLCKN